MSGKLRTSMATLLLLCLATTAQAQRGTINGTVRYAGPTLQPQLELAENARQFCRSVTAAQREVRSGAVGNVVVYLEAMPSVDLDGKLVEVRNVNCDFEPVVQIAQAGARLVLSNNDALAHVVRMYRSRLLVGEYPLAHAGATLTDEFLLERPGLISVQCRDHDWMHSNIWVFDHPHYALTDVAGRFELPFVLPGRYRLTAWHSELGFQTHEVTVSCRSGGARRVPVPAGRHAVKQC